MRQVPELESTLPSIDGDDRVARHFRHYFSPPNPSGLTRCPRRPNPSAEGPACARTISGFLREAL